MQTFFVKTRGVFFLITGFIACPCHLPLTLPLLLALTAGTALGAFLANNIWLIGAAATVYFIAALALGLRYLSQSDKICQTTENKMDKLQNGKSI